MQIENAGNEVKMSQFDDEKRMKEKRQIEQWKQEMEKQEEEKTQNSSIFDEYVEIAGQECRFERRMIGELPCSMYLPVKFRLLTEEEKEIIYPRAKPPMYAYAADDLVFSMAINMTDNPLKPGEVRKFLNISDRIIETLIAKSRVVKKYMTGTDELPVGNVEFTSGGFDGLIYNLMLFVSVDGKLMTINISTNNEFRKQVLPFLTQMAETFRLEEDGDETNNS